MTKVFATFRAVFVTGILLLLIGVVNVQQTPLLVAFLAAFLVLHALEFSARARGDVTYDEEGKPAKIHSKSEDQSRFTTWIVSTSFITNIVIPILQYRYTSPLAAVGWLNWLGLFVFVAGTMLRIWSIRVADDAFLTQVAVEKKHRLVTAGPYTWVRHPAYLGLIIAYTGIAGIFSSAWGLALLLIVIIPTLVVRLLKEEKILAKHFGEEWRQYTTQTHSLLIPGL